MCNRRRLLRQKAGGACLYMPQDGHWKPVLKSPPPPNWLFRGQKNGNCKFPIENRCFRSKISGQNGIFSAKILSRRFRLSRTTSDPSRLIRQRPIDCDRGRHRQMKTDGFLPIFSFQHRQKVSSADLHPQKKPTAKVLWPGGHYSCDKRCGLL